MPTKKKMTSTGPSNSGATPEPIVVPLDFIDKLEIFLEKYWRMVVAVLVLFVAATVVFFYLKYKKEDSVTTSNEAFTSAATRSDLEAVLKEHANTAAAGSALFEIADQQLAAEQLDNAAASLEQFTTEFTEHPLYYNGLIALGGIYERKGEHDKASGLFQKVIDAGDASALAPLAGIYQNEILVAKGELEKAKEAYESFGMTFADNPFVDTAIERLAAVEVRLKKAAAPKAPIEPEDPPAPTPPAAKTPEQRAAEAAIERMKAEQKAEAAEKEAAEAAGEEPAPAETPTAEAGEPAPAPEVEPAETPEATPETAPEPAAE